MFNAANSPQVNIRINFIDSKCCLTGSVVSMSGLQRFLCLCSQPHPIRLCFLVDRSNLIDVLFSGFEAVGAILHSQIGDGEAFGPDI